jgi:hypothetical protein
MSNDLTLLIQNNPALVGTGLDEDTLAVAGNSTGNKRISMKGGVFRKVVGGKEIGAIEDRHMNVIFVKMAHKASRTYYSQGYKEGVKVSPVCWSQDSETPDPEVKNPPSATCKACKYSVKGSGQTGQGAACRLSWRTAVVLPNDPSGDVMQLVLPATSCFGEEVDGKRPFRPYIQMLAQNNISAGRVVTKMQFDTKSPVPKLLFSPAAVVPTEDIPKVIAQAKAAAAESAIKLTVFQQDESVDEAPRGPQFEEEETPEVKEEVVEAKGEEPKLQEAKQEAAKPTDKPDVTDLVQKWAKKKG